MKVLIIRFSSIGDIVLTSPLVRCLKMQRDYKVHFLVKERYISVLRSNPHIDRVIPYRKDIVKVLKKESYDLIIDLQKSFRSLRIRIALNVKAISFHKINIHKWLKVNTPIDILPKSHIVDRYFEAVKGLGIQNDGKGLDFFIDKEAEDLGDQLTKDLNDFGILSMGGAHFTKRIPIDLARKIIHYTPTLLICIGGDDAVEVGNQLNNEFPLKIIDMCGKTNLQVSARLIHNSKYVITGDTGMMHIAAAYQKQIISIWGNTIPEFGMSPYYGQHNPDRNTILEVPGLKCRPCTKIGYDKCPKGHFDCMLKIDVTGLTL